MYSIIEDNTFEFRWLVNKALYIIINDFVEIGSELEPEELYFDVFPSFERIDRKQALNQLNKMIDYFIDSFTHQLSAYDEYVLYRVLEYFSEAYDDGFLITVDMFREEELAGLSQEEKDLIEGEQLKVDYLINSIFGDFDFLYVSTFYEAYKKDPAITEHFLGIDLDYYIELMPSDVREEYLEGRKVDCIGKKEKRCELSFESIVERIISDFHFVITHKKGYTLLYNTEKPVDEKATQNIFRAFSYPYEQIFNVDISPEVDSGRGYLDFKISRGSKDKAIIEFKLDSNSNIENSVEFQLPMYMEAEKSKIGYFVLICFEEKNLGYNDKLIALAKKYRKEHEFDIKIIIINATKHKISASKIKNESEMQFV